MSVLEVRGLTVAFPARFTSGEEAEHARKNSRFVFPNSSKEPVLEKVLDSVSFSLQKGEVLGLVGESGSGKSMTGYAITKLLTDKAPTARLLGGEIHFDGTNLLKISEREMRRKYRGRRISTILQDAKGSFSPVTSIGPQISEMFRLHKGMKRKEAKRATMELLSGASIAHPEDAYDKTIDQLSGGEAQRANIAMMALATKPDILIADEATTALDVTVQAKTLDYLMDTVREYGISLIFITHDFGLVAEYADRVIVLNEGQLVEEGSVQKVFTSPESDFVKNILQNLPRMDKRLREPRAFTYLIKDAVNLRGVSVRFPVPVEGFFRKKEHHVAVRDVSLSLKKGEILGIVGESGSGKTTLMRAALNVLPEDAVLEGDVDVAGRDIYSVSDKELREIRRNIGGVPQGSRQSLTPKVRVSELVGEGMVIHDMFESKRPSEREKEKKEKVLELLEVVELPPQKTFSKFPSQLSGGEQQRIAIARSLMLDPEVLFLDEPTASLDASRKNTILKLLLKLHEERNLSFVVISHELHVIASICDRVAVMWKGRVVEMGSPEKVFTSPAHPYTQTLVSAIPIPDPDQAREQRRKRAAATLGTDGTPSIDLDNVEPSRLEEVPGSPGHFVDVVTKDLAAVRS